LPTAFEAFTFFTCASVFFSFLPADSHVQFGSNFFTRKFLVRFKKKS
jgi:hypothetical protein